MANQEPFSFNSKGRTGEQVPHSGIHHDEAPVREFDNTSLHQAVEQGLIVTPNSPAELVKERKGSWKKPVAAVALLGAVAAGAFGYKQLASGDSAPNPDRKPVATSSPNPGESKPTKAETSEFMPAELSAEQYKDGDALIRAFDAERNKWMMSGSDEEDSIDWANPESSIRSLAEKNDVKFIDTLLVSNWRENPDLQSTIASFMDQHYAVLYANALTTETHYPEDKVPYTQGQDVTMTNVNKASKDTMVVSYRYEMRSNADENRGDQYLTNDVNGSLGGSTVTFQNQNGVWKISDIQSFAG
jgi:hypothetical protein